MSWYIDIDEGKLEHEIMLGSIAGMWIVVGPISIRVRRHPDRDRTGRQSFKESKLLVRPPYGKRDRSRSKLQRIVTSSISGQPERIRGLGLGIAGANGRTISGNISSRIATGLGNRETYASPLPSVDLARQEPSNYG